ncbi:MAG TPA: PaaI family thioesterase [Acidimicrobiia bacterium]
MPEDFAAFHHEQAKGAGKTPAEMARSGLEQTHSDVEGTGTPPPIHYLSGLTPIVAEPGRMDFLLPASGWLVSARGEITSTAISFLADAPIGGAVMTAMPPRTAIPTVELSLLYLGAAEPSEPDLLGQGRMISQDGRTAASTVEVFSGGRRLAVGTTRMMIEPILVPVSAAPLPEGKAVDPFRRPVEGGTVPSDVWQAAAGIEVLRAQLTGDLPESPIARLMGIRLDAVDAGLVVGRALASGWMASPSGTLYGGWAAAALDFAITGAAQSMTVPGGREVMLDLKVNYLRPLVPQGQMLALEARLSHRGGRIVIGEAILARDDGKQVARAVGTAHLRDPPE